MTKSASTTLAAAFAAVSIAAAVSTAHAGAVLTNPAGTLILGVNSDGSLNYTDSSGANTGIAIVQNGVRQDGASQGCLCEGWGVSGNGSAGFANVDTDGGANNLDVVSFTSTASTAVSTTRISDLPNLVVKQSYFPATQAPSNLFQDQITITNTGNTAITDVRYARVIDWDIPPTLFSEFVTIQGTKTTADLAVSHDNGFETANPLAQTNPAFIQTLNTDFTDFGPEDQGSYFDFHFGTLDAGQSLTFNLFYGAALSEVSALDALRSVGAEVYSLGESSTPDGPSLGTPFTFAMAFSGVGGVPILAVSPGAVPEPSTYGLGGAALLAGLIALRRRRTAKSS